MHIRENFSLKNYNTFHVEATAKYFAEVTDVAGLVNILQEFRSRHPEPQLPVLILGGGSNVLFTKNFDGLVLKLDLRGITEEHLDEDRVIITAGSGENWHGLVMHCVGKNYGGLENLALIPGNVGTSPVQNIGAYGVELKDVFVKCTVLNKETLQTEIFDNDTCEFGYRDSIFKNEGKGKYVILDASFLLTKKNHSIHTEYGAIKSELEKAGIKKPSIQDIANIVIAIRQSKLPDPDETGNAGSFFKNPVVDKEVFENLKHKIPEIPAYGNGETVKIPAGWLIEHAGWKGKTLGNAGVHPDQSLVLINKTGKATGEEIFNLSSEIIDSVHDEFGILLEREVNIL